MPPTAHASSRFLLVELPDAEAAGPQRAIEIPPGAWGLDPGTGDELPRLASDAGGGALVIEPLRRERQCLLLLAAPPGETLRINGECTIGLACLRDRDVVQLAERGSFRVALSLRSVVGRAPPEYAGRACPVCHRPIADSIVWICPTCDAAVHAEPEGGAGSGCLLGSECPSCRGPLQRDGDASPAEEGNP